MSIDQRTRLNKDVQALSAAEALDQVIPAAIELHGGLAARGIVYRQSPAVGLDLGSRTATLRGDGDRMVLESGLDRADLVAKLDDAALSDLLQDRQTPMSLAMTSRVQMMEGSFDDWILWEPVWRALMDGRPVHETGAVEMVDADGQSLDLTRTFGLDDDRDEVAHFLLEAGFLHIRDVFTPAEMAAIADDIDTGLAAAQPDDGDSWWATTGDGADVPVRVLNFQEKSATLLDLIDDDRFQWLGELSGDGHRARRSGEGLIKPLDIARGLSDLPWHKDCGQGRHSYFCCSLTVGISVTGADRVSGALGVIPGSHRTNTAHFREADMDLQPFMLETQTGDLTVHCSDTLHKAHPPAERPRKVVYTGFGLPPLPGDEMPAVDPERSREQRANLTDVQDRIDASAGGAVSS